MTTRSNEAKDSSHGFTVNGHHPSGFDIRNGPDRRLLPPNLSAEEAIPGALAESYPIPDVTFKMHYGTAVSIALTLIVVALGWRLSGGLSPLFKFTFIPASLVFGMRVITWWLSCQNRPYETSRDLTELRVVVSLPVYNEDPNLLDRCIYALMSQTRRPDRIDIVDDGSTKVDYSRLKSYWEGRHGGTEITWTWQPNAGKRLAHCTTFRDELAQAQKDNRPLANLILITVDSDTTIVGNGIAEGLKPFADATIMSVGGIELGYNANTNFLTVMQSSLQQVAQAVISAAWSVTGNMFTNRGPFALYRGTVIAEVVDLYGHETFYGHHIKLGDDSLLALAGSMYGKSVQQISAFGLTMWPENLSHHLRQRLRWARGRTIRNFWRLRYYPMTSYIFWFTVTSVYSFIVSSIALMVVLVSWPQSEQLVWRIIGASIVLSWISQLRSLAFHRSDETWSDRLSVILIRPIASLWASIVLTRIIRALGTVTCLQQGWTTRQNGAELTLQPEPQPQEAA